MSATTERTQDVRPDLFGGLYIKVGNDSLYLWPEDIRPIAFQLVWWLQEMDGRGVAEALTAILARDTSHPFVADLSRPEAENGR